MKVTEIIQKDHRTADELDYCFQVLYKHDSTITNVLTMDLIPMNQILDGLRLVSKSRLNTFKWCPFRFKIHYLTRISQESRPDAMIDGKNLHWANQQFWQRPCVSVNDLLTVSTENEITDLFLKRYTQLIPESEQTPFIIRMIHAFVAFESNRIHGIFQSVEQTAPNILNYVFPLATELPIENWLLNLMGIIDVIYMSVGARLICVEYKYGKPKYLDGRPYEKSAITQELAFYQLLVRGSQVYMIQNQNGTDVAVPITPIINNGFTYGSMVFFQDLSTAQLFPIMNRHINAVKKDIAHYWNTLDNGNFNPDPKDSCYQWCDFQDGLCDLNPEWVAIDHAMDDDK